MNSTSTPTPELGYCIALNTRQYNAWWRACREMNRPFIVVEYWSGPKGTGSVTVDFDTCDNRTYWFLTDAGRQAIEVLLRSTLMVSKHRKCTAYTPSDSGSPYQRFGIHAANRENCEPLAKMLAHIITVEHREMDRQMYWTDKYGKTELLTI